MAFQMALSYRWFIFGGTSSQVGMKFKVPANLAPSWREVKGARNLIAREILASLARILQ